MYFGQHSPMTGRNDACTKERGTGPTRCRPASSKQSTTPSLSLLPNPSGCEQSCIKRILQLHMGSDRLMRTQGHKGAPTHCRWGAFFDTCNDGVRCFNHCIVLRYVPAGQAPAGSHRHRLGRTIRRDDIDCQGIGCPQPHRTNPHERIVHARPPATPPHPHSIISRSRTHVQQGSPPRPRRSTRLKVVVAAVE